MNYAQQQIDRLKPEGFTGWGSLAYPVTIQLRSEHGHTNCMNLTAEQVAAIEAILTGGEQS